MNEDGSPVVSGSFGGTVRGWNALNAKYGVSAVEKKKERTAIALCVSVDRKVVAAGYDDGGISAWDVETERMKGIELAGQIVE